MVFSDISLLIRRDGRHVEDHVFVSWTGSPRRFLYPPLNYVMLRHALPGLGVERSDEWGMACYYLEDLSKPGVESLLER